ncbi:MAG: hypothetical protein M3Z31_11785 [Pseudomonadota bacterium]|nr:hypothetical protein [Pseudomonadota bacterium]
MGRFYTLDRPGRVLTDDRDQRFDPPTRSWMEGLTHPAGELVDAIAATTWMQRESGAPCRMPIGVIGPREATSSQLQIAEAVGRGIGAMGLTLLCGGREGVMSAAGRGAVDAGGLTIGLLPDTDPRLANPYMAVVIATGIGEARNALIARASLCLVAIGNSHGTLSEVALGRHFGKLVIGLEGAAQVEGVRHVGDVAAALCLVAECVMDATRPISPAPPRATQREAPA